MSSGFLGAVGKSCEIAEISLFEDKLFSIADHETCILLGRRKNRDARVSTVMYRRVRNKDMDEFKSSLAFSREDSIAQAELGQGVDASLYEPDLRDVWRALAPSQSSASATGHRTVCPDPTPPRH